MNHNIKQGLEKVVNFVKDNSKKAIAIGATISCISAPLHAGKLTIGFKGEEDNAPGNSQVEVLHTTPFAYEWVDFSDTPYSSQGSGPFLEIYSKTKVSSPDKLSVDARPLNSYSKVNLEIAGKGLDSPVNKELEVKMGIDKSMDRFDGKKIIGSLYNSNQDPSEAVRYDFRNMTKNDLSSQIPIPLTIDNGVSYKLDVDFYDTNIADFNNDGIVNLADYAILAKDWGKTNVNSLADITGFHSISDGNVDSYDLSLFSHFWLNDAFDE